MRRWDTERESLLLYHDGLVTSIAAPPALQYSHPHARHKANACYIVGRHLQGVPLNKFPAFTEPEVSLSCSQEPTTGPYINLTHIFSHYLVNNSSNIIFPSTPRSSEWSLPLRFSDHNVVVTCVLHVPTFHSS